MRIGIAARHSGVPARTIRYYESVGLLRPPRRDGSGYRDYGEAEVETLRFVCHARRLGFSVRDITDLLALWRDDDRASADVRRIAQAHVADIEERIGQLQAMRVTLLDLIHACHGDQRPECPILQGLVEGRGPASGKGEKGG